MASSQKLIRAFLASPSDVGEERAKAEEIVIEFNLAWSTFLRARLELLKWESHTFPSAGEDGQSVINRQIGDDYDIFIGIMGTRFGSPTSRFESGTEEEFTRAWRRHQKGENVRIMFYFKDAPVSPSKIDLDQLLRVNNFKSKIGDEGIYYWSFSSLDAFETLIRLHLSRQMQELVKDGDAGNLTDNQDQNNICVIKGGEDLGILDMLIVVDDRFALANEAIRRFVQENIRFRNSINANTNALKQANIGRDKQVGNKEIKDIIDRAAEAMDIFVAATSSEVSILDGALREGMHALSKAATLISSVDVGEAIALRGNVKMVSDLDNVIRETCGKLVELKGAVERIPHMTTPLVAAKHRTIYLLNRLISTLDNARKYSTEAHRVLSALLGS